MPALLHLTKPWRDGLLHLRPGNRIVQHRFGQAGSPAPIRPFAGVVRLLKHIRRIRAPREMLLTLN